MNYKIIYNAHHNIEKFTEEVEEWINGKGYKPLGGIVVSKDYLYQTLVQERD